MSNYCCIIDCSSGPTDLVSFHRAPSDEEKRRIWMNNIGKTKRGLTPTAASRICSRHFVDGRPTEANPFPVLLMGHEGIIDRVGRATETSRRVVESMKELRLEAVVNAVVDGGESHARAVKIMESVVNNAVKIVEANRQHEIQQPSAEVIYNVPLPLWNHDYVRPPPGPTGDEFAPTPPRIDDWPFHPTSPKRRTSKRHRFDSDLDELPASTAPDDFLLTNGLVEMEDVEQSTTSASGESSSITASSEAGTQTDFPNCPIDWTALEGNDAKTKYYTGLEKFETLEELYELIKDDADKLNLDNSSVPKIRPWPKRKLELRNELLITLMKIRLNFDNVHLANVFEISETRISLLLAAWIPFLACKLRLWISWTNREEMADPPKCYELFPNCIGVIDCFEVVVEKSGTMIDLQHYWSQYKHNYTIKVLVCISPNTRITYISDSWGGRTTDQYLVEHDEEFVSKLREGDVILADKGFDVKEFLLLKGVRLLMPKFLTMAQFSREDVERNRKLSSARIHVERAIGQLRNFNILADKIPAHLFPFVDDILIICASICNMRAPLVKS